MNELFAAIEHDTSNLVRYTYVQQDPTISELWEHRHWHEFLSVLETKVCGSNIELFRELMEIYHADQSIRREIMENIKLHGQKSEQVLDLEEVMQSRNSDHVTKIESILSKYGYPSKDLVGEANNVAFLVIQHSDLELQKRYFGLFSAAVNDGEIKKSSLAMMEDRILIGEGKEQKYGTQICRDADTGIAKFCLPMDDLEQVRIRREKVGLSTLESYARKSGVELN